MKFPTQSNVLAYRSIYGDPRGARPDQASLSWQRANLIRITPPYRMTYAGTPIKGVTIHKACAPAFAGLFELLKTAAKGKQETLDHWGVSIFGGSFNYRLMRNLSTLSMHSFGCAIDLDPARNGLGDRTPRFAEFPEVVKAFRDSGLCWGADWDGDGNTANTRTFDGMHLQATQPVK